MDNERFEAWLRALEDGISRRGVLGILGGLGIAAAPGIAGAKRGKRRTRKGARARGASRVSAQSVPAARGQGQYQTLGAKWWVWAFDEEFAPIIEDGAVDCAEGQQGKTWFLAGSFFPEEGDPVTTVERSCTVPDNVKLFFPVVNSICGQRPNLFVDPDPNNEDDEERVRVKQQLAVHRACAEAGIAAVDPATLTAKVNGDEVQIVRAQSALVPIHFAEGNVFGEPEGVQLGAADGYWVLLDPLPPGDYTIEFAAPSLLSVIYHLTVV